VQQRNAVKYVCAQTFVGQNIWYMLTYGLRITLAQENVQI